MHVNIIIPTWNRPKLLLQAIASITKSTYKDYSIIVIVDGNLKLIDSLIKQPIMIIVNPTSRDWVYSVNRGLRLSVADAIMYAADDIVLTPSCLAIAVAALKEKFPDGNGLIGINQTVVGCSSAFGLMGRKFVDHFPNRQVFCPDYIHLASDFEVGKYARANNIFYYCKEAVMNHYRLRDETWQRVAKVKDRDLQIQAQRVEKKLIWGNSWEKLIAR